MSKWIFSLILVELLFVSWIDIRIKKISNLWCLFNLMLAIAFHIFLQADYPLAWATLVFPVGWIIGGFILFILGIMGAGDSKYLASLFLLIPLEQQAVVFEKIIIATLIVGVLMLTIKLGRDFQKLKAYALSSYWAGLKESIRSHFSYAPVILLAWLMFGAEIWL